MSVWTFQWITWGSHVALKQEQKDTRNAQQIHKKKQAYNHAHDETGELNIHSARRRAERDGHTCTANKPSVSGTH